MGFKDVLIQNLMSVTLLLSTVLGVTIGTTLIGINHDPYSKRVIMYVGYPGDIFLRMVGSVILPLTVSCIVFSLGTVNRHLIKRLGYQFMIYNIVSKLQVAILAACLGMAFRPGKTMAHSGGPMKPADQKLQVTIIDTFLDAVRNMFPVNLLEVTLRHYTTRLVNTNNYTIDDLVKWDVLPEDQRLEFQNLLGIVSVSVVIGITLNLIEEEGYYMLSLVKCVVKSTMIITMWAMRLAPFAIMFKIARDILNMEGGIHILTQMSRFIVVLFTAYTIQLGIIYPLVYLVCVRKNPIKLFWNFFEPIMIALTTAKSNAALPYALYCLRKKIHNDSRIVDFAMPMGACLNRDGSTIWLVLGAIFITELNDMPMDLGEVGIIVLYSVLAGMSSSGVPSASIVRLNTLLLSRGLPSRGVNLLNAIEWICIRYRSVVNLCGNAVAVCVLNQINLHILEEFPKTVTPPEEINIDIK